MRLKVITSNPGKVEEFRREFADWGVEMEHAHIPYDEIQTSELEEVVKAGMEELHSNGLRDFVIDDSGMFVDALKGFPGVYSSYVQKTVGNAGVLRLMEDGGLYRRYSENALARVKRDYDIEKLAQKVLESYK